MKFMPFKIMVFKFKSTHYCASFFKYCFHYILSPPLCQLLNFLANCPLQSPRIASIAVQNLLTKKTNPEIPKICCG